MAIRDKVPQPPSSLTGPLGEYLGLLARAINGTPTISYFSGTHPNSTVTGFAGDIAINVAPSSTASRMFIAYGSTTTRGKGSWNTVA